MFPIIQRELMVSSKKPWTFRVRMATTLVAIIVAFFFLILSYVLSLFSPGAGSNLGQTLFTGLCFYALGLSMLAGVLLASDCISSEKREGTLGLLFLTDLNGFDVVFGKWLGVGLNAFYGLLAALPVFGISLCLGGTTGGEFFRVSLALLNILLFSLTAGLFASVVCRRSLGSLLLASAIVLGGIFIPAALRGLASLGGVNEIYIDWLSPFTSFKTGSDIHYSTYPLKYWGSLVGSGLLSLAMLVAAAVALPRIWARTESQESSQTQPRFLRKLMTPSRKPISDENPVVWLLNRNQWIKALAAFLGWFGIFLLVLVIGFICFYSYGMVATTRMFVSTWLVSGGVLLLKFLFAYVACWLFADSRRTGALELIASTPLSNREILGGQWEVLIRTFRFPVIVFICLGMAALVQATIVQKSVLTSLPLSAKMSSSGSGSFAVYASTHILELGWLFLAVRAVLNPLLVILGFAAVGYLGMWLGLSSKTPATALGWTVLFGVVLPTFGLCIPSFIIHLFIIFWSKRKMEEEFRRLVILQPPETPLLYRTLAGAPPPKV